MSENREPSETNRNIPSSADSVARVVDLSVGLGPLRLENPVMCASGTFGYGDELPALTEVAALGAIVTKTVTVEPRAGNPPPRLCETPGGLLNSIGLQNVGCEAFVSEVMPRLLRLGPPVIVSVGGREVEEYVRCSVATEEAGAAALEINISCPNVASGLEFSRSPLEASKVISAVRRAVKQPIFAKLSPNVTDIAEIGKACLDAGADGLTAVNTFVGMVVDPDRRQPVLRRGTGGLSGPAIRPLALAKVWDLARAVRGPLIGAGGITTARDALEFIIVGASAVQVGTASFRDAARGARIVEGLREYLQRQGVSRLEELIGTLELPPVIP